MAPIVSTITRTALNVGTQAASLGFKAAKFAVGRVAGLVGGGSDDDARYAPNLPQPDAKLGSVGDKPSSRPLEAVPQPQKADASPAPAPQPTSAPVPRRTSNPKQARKVRARAKAANVKAADLEARGAKGRGGRPATTKAENTPSERAAAGAGREAAPLGAEDRTDK
jgi:hypothetical protein